MTEQLKAEAHVREQRPALMELTFGCEVDEIYWYKTETHKKENQPDWMYSREGGDYGIVVKDLRSDFLPMLIDKGDQLEFQIQPDDIVSMKIIGHPIQLQDWLAVLGGIKSKRTFSIDEDGECFADIGYDRNYVCKFNLTTGQPATEADYRYFCDIIGL